MTIARLGRRGVRRRRVAPDFWQPLVGDGAFAITRTMVVMVLVTIGLASSAARRRAARGGARASGSSAVEGVLRPGPQRHRPRHHRSHDFRRFVPLLLTLFTLILVNNLFGIIPPSSSRR